jgi:hypothetical protein
LSDLSSREKNSAYVLYTLVLAICFVLAVLAVLAANAVLAVLAVLAANAVLAVYAALAVAAVFAVLAVNGSQRSSCSLCCSNTLRFHRLDLSRFRAAV